MIKELFLFYFEAEPMTFLLFPQIYRGNSNFLNLT